MYRSVRYIWYLMLKPLSIQVFSSSGYLLNTMIGWYLPFVSLRLSGIMRAMVSGFMQWLTSLSDSMIWGSVKSMSLGTPYTTTPWVDSCGFNPSAITFQFICCVTSSASSSFIWWCILIVFCCLLIPSIAHGMLSWSSMAFWIVVAIFSLFSVWNHCRVFSFVSLMLRAIVDWILCSLIRCCSWCLCSWAAVMEDFTVSAYVFSEVFVFGSLLFVCIVSRLAMLVLIWWRTSIILVFSEAGVGVGAGAFVVLICSYACWNVVAIFSNVVRSIVILWALVLLEALYISCSCLRAWNISCSASESRHVDEVSVEGAVVVSWWKFFFPSLVLLGGLWASVDGSGRSWTVLRGLVDALLAVVRVAVAFLRVSLFTPLLVAIRNARSPLLYFKSSSELQNRSFLSGGVRMKATILNWAAWCEIH